MADYRRILYIGPYRELSGAGNCARNYIQALFEQGHDLCIAPIFRTGEIYPDNQISSDILPLEKNHLKKYDIVIQHCHPFDYVYNSSFDINIGLFQFNSATINPCLISRLALMDRIVVNSNFNKNILTKISNINCIVIPELIDINLCNGTYVDYEWLNKDRPVVFYTVGDMVERKNISQIIKAFLYTFNDQDNVELVIKTKPHFSHKSLDIINKEISYIIDKTYASLRLDKQNRKQPKIMVGQFDYEYLLALHKNSNVYVDASMAENFGYSCLEAALFDNYLIVNSNSSTSEISDLSIKTKSRPVYINDSYTTNFIENTAKDMWYEIDFHSLCDNLKSAYYLAINKPKIQHDLNKYAYPQIEKIL